MKIASNTLVAVVDDDRRVLDSLEDLLASAGFAPRVFSSAQEFLASGDLQSIGCLVSDICMPDIDGWQLESIAKRWRPELPVILISAHDDFGTESRVDERARAIFRKPFDAQELLATIAAAMVNGQR